MTTSSNKDKGVKLNKKQKSCKHLKANKGTCWSCGVRICETCGKIVGNGKEDIWDMAMCLTMRSCCSEKMECKQCADKPCRFCK